LAPILGRDKRDVDGGGGAPPKVLEAYMGEAFADRPPRSILGNVLRVVVVLF
jgi:hypothetical protein